MRFGFSETTSRNALHLVFLAFAARSLTDVRRRRRVNKKKKSEKEEEEELRRRRRTEKTTSVKKNLAEDDWKTRV